MKHSEYLSKHGGTALVEMQIDMEGFVDENWSDVRKFFSYHKGRNRLCSGSLEDL